MNQSSRTSVRSFKALRWVTIALIASVPSLGCNSTPASAVPGGRQASASAPQAKPRNAAERAVLNGVTSLIRLTDTRDPNAVCRRYGYPVLSGANGDRTWAAPNGDCVKVLGDRLKAARLLIDRRYEQACGLAVERSGDSFDDSVSWCVRSARDNLDGRPTPTLASVLADDEVWGLLGARAIRVLPKQARDEITTQHPIPLGGTDWMRIEIGKISSRDKSIGFLPPFTLVGTIRIVQFAKVHGTWVFDLTDRVSGLR